MCVCVYIYIYIYLFIYIRSTYINHRENAVIMGECFVRNRSILKLRREHYNRSVFILTYTEYTIVLFWNELVLLKSYATSYRDTIVEMDRARRRSLTDDGHALGLCGQQLCDGDVVDHVGEEDTDGQGRLLPALHRQVEARRRQHDHRADGQQ